MLSARLTAGCPQPTPGGPRDSGRRHGREQRASRPLRSCRAAALDRRAPALSTTQGEDGGRVTKVTLRSGGADAPCSGGDLLTSHVHHLTKPHSIPEDAGPEHGPQTGQDPGRGTFYTALGKPSAACSGNTVWLERGLTRSSRGIYGCFRVTEILWPEKAELFTTGCLSPRSAWCKVRKGLRPLAVGPLPALPSGANGTEARSSLAGPGHC